MADVFSGTECISLMAFPLQNILYVYPEDSGIYKCVARNAAGEATTQCTLTCIGQRTMYLETQHPDSLQRIQELEAPRQLLPEQPEAPKQPPQFTAQLQAIEGLKEGQTAHFECQVIPTDDPNLRIEWLFNGRPLAASHRFRMVHEFGYVGFGMDSYPSYVEADLARDLFLQICSTSIRKIPERTRAAP